MINIVKIKKSLKQKKLLESLRLVHDKLPTFLVNVQGSFGKIRSSHHFWADVSLLMFVIEPFKGQPKSIKGIEPMSLVLSWSF
jgi:hypothetical protein